jgi:hypothetical protein
MKRAGAGIAAIYPQQSIREMQRTNRTATEVMSEALQGAADAGWTDPIGADADHLKTNADVDVTAAAGFTFFTIDPSGHVDPEADSYTEVELGTKFAAVKEHAAWFDSYKGKSISLPSAKKVDLSEVACMRAAVKYGKAIEQAVKLADYIREVQEGAGREYEIELSVDETEQPTTLAEHYIIADQCIRHGMKLVSLAPRFIGDFEKGIDYKGDLDALEQSLANHAAIAELLGPYKLSLHSGSDKISMYPALARATKGKFHVKTAGTSYLEALRVAAQCDSDLFREIIEFSRTRFETDKATYHISATLDGVPAPADLADTKDIERHYLELWEEVPAGKGFTKPGRQIVHVTFGSVLTHEKLGPALLGLLKERQDVYTEVLVDHFARHLEALRAGM